MITPKYLKENDIAYSSLSNGIVKEEKCKKLQESKELLKEFKIIDDKYVNKSYKGESAPARQRTKELKRLIKDDNVKAIISITGGNFLNEILDYSNLSLFKDNIKWVQGQSDSTILLYYLTTKFDIKTIYSFNANSLAKASNK